MPGSIRTRLPRPHGHRRLRVSRPSTWWPTLAMREDEAFRNIWQALRQHDRVLQGAPEPSEWQDRADQFAMCVIPVPHAPEILRALEPLREALGSYSHVRLYTDDQLHIPIQELGFIVDQPTKPDETSFSRITDFARHAAVPVTDFPAFRVEIGGFNSFLDVSFLDVIDDGWCYRLHHRLRDFVPCQLDDTFAYLPHVVLGDYTTTTELGSFPAKMAPWRDRRYGVFTADCLQVIAISTRDFHTSPEILHSFELGHERGAAETIASPAQDFR